jgi:hypothetical protein
MERISLEKSEGIQKPCGWPVEGSTKGLKEVVWLNKLLIRNIKPYPGYLSQMKAQLYFSL